jgi:hypothetical protein
MPNPTYRCEHCGLDLEPQDRVVYAAEPTPIVDASDTVRTVDGAFVYFLEDHWPQDSPEAWHERRRGTLQELRGY